MSIAGQPDLKSWTLAMLREGLRKSWAERDAAEARAAEAERERDELRATIFGSADYWPSLKNGNFVEMARSTEAARQGALSSAKDLTRRLSAAVEAAHTVVQALDGRVHSRDARAAVAACAALVEAERVEETVE